MHASHEDDDDNNNNNKYVVKYLEIQMNINNHEKIFFKAFFYFCFNLNSISNARQK